MTAQEKLIVTSKSVRSTAIKLVIPLLMVQVTLVENVLCGHVLIWPTDASHWLNIKIIIQELINRDHHVSILVPTTSLFITSGDIAAANFEVYSVPFTKEEFNFLIMDMIKLWWDNKPSITTFYRFYLELGKLMEKVNKLNRQMCEAVLSNQELMSKLKNAKYDVLLSDPVMQCGDLIAVKLNIPFLYTLRFSPASTVERHCGKMPAPPSYVPAALSGFTDKLSFGERIKNIMSYYIQDYVFQKYWGEWDSYYSQVLGRPTTLCEIMGKAEIWLIRTYWDFEFPRPFLPNFEFVGGLHCQPAKPLSEVIWRYKGKKLEMLGANTRTYDWIPQNDLLGHPKTKAFITHGGTNGIYEAIYHAIPIVGIPLFADQTDNIIHMKVKGMAVELDIHTMKAEDLVNAVNTVIHNDFFKKNALKVSQFHHEQPIKPLDRAIFWIEFVIRHKGAKHLQVAAYHLTWYQYHCLDVIAFLIGCTVVFAFITFKCCSYCFWKCGNILQKSKTD
ncbi:UDP-glucuronosyltransferase 2A2-like isoform X2 [Pantherophis guttatus]|uniref:UDP-glucuronosyltransferase n=1 Tax=Pantherophis guttatus TaxID=94885 RepID=A0ABM3ZH90_PANGU|nr:UDP-glucuronosyltransferase 2A2-like isoform X2 [Pantherophis guttatus]